MGKRKIITIKPTQNIILPNKTVIKSQQADGIVSPGGNPKRTMIIKPNGRSLLVADLPSLIKPFPEIYNNKKSNAVFIVGGGPSLSGFNFGSLKNVDTIAVNKAIEYVPGANYFISIDYTYLSKAKTSITEISKSKTETVFVVNTGESVQKRGDYYIDTRFNLTYKSLNQFNHVIESKKPLTETGFGKTFENFAHGYNSGFAALQFALLLGYEKIYLLGFDLNVDDADTHFHSDYRGSVTKKNIPKFLEHFHGAFSLTKDLHKIYSCSESSSLNHYLQTVSKSELMNILGSDKNFNSQKMVDLSDLVVVGYYTVNTPYEQEAEKLKTSCRKFNLNHDIVGVANLGNWQANTRFKAKFMLDMLSKHAGKRLLYVDCDAVFHSIPKLFINYSADIAVRFQDFNYRKNECLSGTIYMENNLKTRRLCELWANKNVAEGPQAKTFEQWNLGAVIEQMAKTDNLVCKNLPPEYTFIFDSMRRMYPNAVPVIEHFQASRRFKNKLQK
jgi:hypothetical protein